MKIELNEDQQEEVVFAALLSLEEHFPEDKKLSKAIKRVLSYTMSPGDWEMIYSKDWLEYSEPKEEKSATDLDFWAPKINFSSIQSPEEQKIEKARKGNV
jgi:hypothetical protein|tara:strand:- start:652 stop:951 length:300 start_codon:yes stop_codon:yes gene_type:complete